MLLVAEAGLGAVNAVRLSVGAVASSGCPRITVVLNRFDADDPLHRRNRQWLEVREGLDVTALPGDEDLLVAVLGRPG